MPAVHCLACGISSRRPDSSAVGPRRTAAPWPKTRGVAPTPLCALFACAALARCSLGVVRDEVQPVLVLGGLDALRLLRSRLAGAAGHHRHVIALEGAAAGGGAGGVRRRPRVLVMQRVKHQHIKPNASNGTEMWH